MVTCSVSTCKNKSTKITKNKDGITFHRFPRDKLRRRQWELAINREKGWKCSNSSAVCSEHFHESDFYSTENGLRRLSLDALPGFNISPCQQPDLTIADSEPVNATPSDSEEMMKLKLKVRRLEVIAENRRRNLLILSQSRRRLRIKFEKMRQIVKHLVRFRRDSETRCSECCGYIFGK